MRIKKSAQKLEKTDKKIKKQRQKLNTTDSCSKSIVKVWLQSNVIHNGDLKKDKNNRRLDHKKKRISPQ